MSPKVKRAAVVLVFMLFVSFLMPAQRSEEETYRLLNEASNNLAAFADTFRVTSETTQQMQMDVTADRNRLTEKSATRVILTADVHHLDDGESEASGEFSVASQESTVNNGNRSDDRQAISGEIRLVDDTLYMNARSHDGTRLELPGGWAVLAKGFARAESIQESFLFEFPGIEELDFDELRSQRPHEWLSKSDVESFLTALELGSTSASDSVALPDGTEAQRMAVELTGADVQQLGEIFDPLANLDDSIPLEMLETMVLTISFLIDDGNLFRGFEMSAQLRIHTTDLAAMFGDTVPPGTEGSVSMQATFTERVIYTNINDVVEPVARP